MTPSLGTPQGDLFGGALAHLEPSLVREAPTESQSVELSTKLPQTVRLGTSSWAFPGWAGIVYDRTASVGALSRRGLDPYSRHPLLGCVGVDRTFYSPLPATQFEEYAALVPPKFRFVVKADRALTFPRFTHGAAGAADTTVHENPDFLNPQRARDAVVGPTVHGLGEKLGAILFQFPPMHPRAVGGPGRFASDLGRFLKALPTGIPYAVELRTRELLCPVVLAAISEAGATLVRLVHPSLPPIGEQADSGPSSGAAGPLIIRWMLGHGQSYNDAKDRYAPFDRLVDPDPLSRGAIATMCIDAALEGLEVYVIVNNKAEGSSPLSIRALAHEIACQASQ